MVRWNADYKMQTIGAQDGRLQSEEEEEMRPWVGGGYVRALLSVSARHSLTSARAWMMPAGEHTKRQFSRLVGVHGVSPGP